MCVYVYSHMQSLEQSVTMLSLYLESFDVHALGNQSPFFASLIRVGYFFPLMQPLETMVNAAPQNKGACTHIQRTKSSSFYRSSQTSVEHARDEHFPIEIIW